jgi:CDP-diacylglycerol--serine O-phosphatidyltransferase
MRLARFNVEHARDDAGHRLFHGLPSPGAAAAVASLVILQQVAREPLARLFANALPALVLGLAILMVSNVRYVHVANTYLIGRRPFEQFVIVVIGLGFFLWHPAPVLAAVVMIYVLSGPTSAAVQWFRARPPARRKAVRDHPDQEDTSSPPSQMSG